ncbi:unnamed protein product [Rotaria sp. Silwood1]|nr:unnamed protein product [Rotaria sp. Silwood1]CAF1008584.1 unnamed protein product [Rotaria sp. Silwood1]CAF3424878.1 unnamed protein product [Rotaria sp. Silwood1]
MNAYTLDPPKTESKTEYVPISPSAPVLQPAPVPVTASAPVYVPPSYQYYPYQHSPPRTAQPNISKIQDWLAWSIINLILGSLILGILPLIFSLICRSKKAKNDISSARKMSTLALVFNIIVTTVGILVVTAGIIYLLVSRKVIRYH